jgi:hypothetical protein
MKLTMKQYWVNSMRLLVGAYVLVFGLTAAGRASAETHRPSKQQMAAIAAMPLTFEKNVGQVDKRASYLSRMSDYTLFVTGSDSILTHSGKAKDTAAALRLHWLGASDSVSPQGDAEMRGKSNYMIGNDRSEWHSDVPNYQRVKEDGLYPGVDLVYYGNHEQLEYDLTVAPGADPSTIKLAIDGAKKLHIDAASGDLVILDQLGSELRLHKPVVYQQVGEQKTNVVGSYLLSANKTVSFALGAYDHAKPLVIDPTVVYSTLFGGASGMGCYYSGSYCSPGDAFSGIDVDTSGNVYMLLLTYAMDVPTTTGAYQTTCQTGTTNGKPYCYAFVVAKFDPTQIGAASLIYSTYIGGTTNLAQYSSYIQGAIGLTADTWPDALAVDSAGDAYLTGYVATTSYPTTSNAYLTSYAAGCVNGSSSYYCLPAGVISKLNPTGTSLLYSSYLPMNSIISGQFYSSADLGGLLAVDSNQIAYVAGMGGGHLPTTDTSACTSWVNCSTPYLVAINTTKSGSSSLAYSEYLPLYDLGSMAVDPSGDVYLGGLYSSTGFPSSFGITTQTITFNGYQGAPSGSWPTLLRLNPSGTITYATTVGAGSAYSVGSAVRAISADANGNAYVAIVTTGAATQLNGLATTSNYTGIGPYIAKFKTDNSVSGANSLLYATYLAPDSYSPSGITSLSCNNAGLVAFAGLGGQTTNAPNYSLYTQVNPITEPTLSAGAFSQAAYAGLLDTTKTGNSALTFLSFTNGVWYPNRVVLAADSKGNPVLDLGGSSQGSGSTVNPVLFTLGSYSTTAGGLNTVGAPFFYKIATAAAQLTVAPTTLTFGVQGTGSTSASQPVTLTNTGTTAIAISSIVPSAGFTQNNNCGTSLAGGASCTVNVSFAPTATGAISGTIRLTDGDSSSPQNVVLGGTGTVILGPVASLTPTSNGFGNQTVNTTSGGQVFVLSNATGTAALTGISVSLTGANTADFGVSNACGTTLAVGSTCNISVTFTPLSVASFSATLSVSDNATGSPQTSSLSGTGTAIAQTINFTAPTTPVTYGVAPISLVATGGASGNAVTLSVVSGPASVSGTNGSTLTITGVGTVVVAANQTGNSNYAAATQVTQSIVVNQATQTINFTAPTTPVTYGVAPISLVATGGASSNAVIFSVVSGPASVSGTNGSTLTITGVGTVVVAANQTGNSNYAAATQVTQSITVNVIGVAATPTFLTVAGTYATAQSVAINDTTPGATIYYTTNGTAPTTSSSVYNGAIPVASTEMLEAIATATGYSTSAVATAAYTIANPVPVVGGISPAFTNAGGSVFTLTVNGSGFISNSTIYWGSTALTTTYVTAGQLTAQVPAADIATAGTIAISVQSPAPGGGSSNAWQFEVDSVSSGTNAPTITSIAETVTAGTTASYPVTIPSAVTSISVACLNLPTGATCSYNSTTNAVTINTSSSTPKGTYQITLVFTETVTGTASGFIFLPILLLPLLFMRKRYAARGFWLTASLGLILLAGAAVMIGCGGGGGSGSSAPATQQVIRSGAVSLTVQ